MLAPADFLQQLQAHGVGFYTGVPDSLLKSFLSCLGERVPARAHVITANEGAAVALACGHHLATGKVALVYLQNSGLGNAVNPLLSLSDPQVYAIPLLLLIGWRGEPGVQDEPQHLTQGRVTERLLQVMDIPYRVLDAQADAETAIAQTLAAARERAGPAALLVRRGTFAEHAAQAPSARGADKRPTRERAIELLLAHTGPQDVLVATTGMAARELYELRERLGDGHANDFLTVGSMGHSATIALGIAREHPQRRVWCLDGDGALLMHMGCLAINGTSGCANLRHVVLNNGAHASVGGQPTVGLEVSFAHAARACGYAWTEQADDLPAAARLLPALAGAAGPALLDLRLAPGRRADLGRPTTTPGQNKRDLMALLR